MEIDIDRLNERIVFNIGLANALSKTAWHLTDIPKEYWNDFNSLLSLLICTSSSIYSPSGINLLTEHPLSTNATVTIYIYMRSKLTIKTSNFICKCTQNSTNGINENVKYPIINIKITNN